MLRDATAKADEDDAEQKEKPKKGAAALVEIAADCELFVDEIGEAYAAIPLATGGRAVRKITSEKFKGWLTLQHLEKTGQIAGREARGNAVDVLEAQARLGGVCHPLSERFARTDGAIWIDMCTEDWSAVKITEQGWTIETRPPCLFRRHPHMRSLPAPERDGNLLDLFKFLNVSDEADRLLILAWLVAAVFDGLPRPALILQGLKGTAKTTGAKVLRSITDPSKADVLRPPRNEDELVHHLGGHAVAVYDNLPSVPPWMADGLCRAITGAASEKRKLFTDAESVLVTYKRPIILTGINTPSAAPDLLDRTLLVDLQPVPQNRRRAEEEFWPAFEKLRPMLFGALLTTIAETLRRLPMLQLGALERMADFTRIGAAAAEALGFRAGTFLLAYGRSAGRQTTEALESDSVAVAIRMFISQGREFDGTVGEFYRELRKLVPVEKGDGFPGNTAALGKRLRVLMPSLKEVGIEVKPYDGAKNERRVSVAAAGGAGWQQPGSEIASADKALGHGGRSGSILPLPAGGGADGT